MQAIRHAVPHLRATLGREIRLKYLPSLEVLEDTTAAYGERIEQLLREAGVSKPPVVGVPVETGQQGVQEMEDADE